MQGTNSRFGTAAVTAALLVGILVGSVAAAAVAGAEETSQAQTSHPVVGVWLAMVPGPADAPTVATPMIFSADGRVMLAGAVTQSGPEGVRWASGGMGAWERTDERSVTYRVVQVLSDADGAYVGTATIEGSLTVGEDGTTATDASPASRVTVRGPAGSIVQVIDGHRDTQPAAATRISVTSPLFPSGPGCGRCGPQDW